jgi:GT2 family glycosyltransferase
MKLKHVVVIVACYNRRKLTVRCLDRLSAQINIDGVRLDAIVIDDGSTDGTADALELLFPSAIVVRHSGELYWSRAVSLGMEFARLIFPECDALLLLNDDVETELDCIARLSEVALGLTKPAVVVGATESPEEAGRMTYSGFKRTGAGALSLVQIEPSSSVQFVDTMNGNIVLIPKSISDALGPIDGTFIHGGGDIDYGYRVRTAGFDIALAPGYLGRCATNSQLLTFRDTTISRRARLSLMVSAKGLPPRTFYELYRRHGGRFGRFRFIAFYTKSVLSLFAKEVEPTHKRI